LDFLYFEKQENYAVSYGTTLVHLIVAIQTRWASYFFSSYPRHWPPTIFARL